jgi:hypothetical protein
MRMTAVVTESRMDALDREIQLREAAARQLGFDSLHLAADFVEHGMPSVDCPFDLPRGEVAHLVTAATPALPAHGPVRIPGYAGALVPSTHTGIRQWVGWLRNRSAPVAGPHPAGAGVLAVTNLRLLFGASQDWLEISIESVLDMDVYEDGISISQLGRESPHLLLLDAPRLVAFYVNWVIFSDRRVSPSRRRTPAERLSS